MKVLACAVMCATVVWGCASAPPAPAAAPKAMDWSAVEGSKNGVQIMAWKTVARHCDAWYKGSKPVIDLRFNPDGHAEDGAGHRMPVRAADWKGIVESTRIAGKEVEAFAALSELYSSGREEIPQDKFGIKARYRYRVTAVSDDVLRYTVIDKLDGGV
jgi:hypothetical protein